MAVKFRDYYEVLGVPRQATADEIKRAYRRLARKHHPDVHPAAERAKASETFKEINEAYAVLSDADKRARYDSLGANWKGGMDFTPPPGAGWSTGEAGEWQDLGDFSDFFASVFGAGARTRRRRSGTRLAIPGNDVEAELPVSLEELLSGGKRRITIDGKSLDVEIPLGARDGTTLRLAGQGGAGRGGAPSGDLFLHLRMAPHPRYRVSDDDLEVDLELWPWQAVLGAEVRLETPEGAVALKVPPASPAGGRLRLKGRGLPRREGGRGDLYASIKIVVPERPTAADREAYEALKKSAGKPE